ARTSHIALLAVGLAVSGCGTTAQGPTDGASDGGVVLGDAAPSDASSRDASPNSSPGDASPGDGAPPPSCTGVALTTSGALDVDIRTVEVSGMVTVNGTALSTGVANVGAIVFTETTSGAAASVAIRSTGGYRVTLAPGRYDIGYTPGTCNGGSP